MVLAPAATVSLTVPVPCGGTSIVAELGVIVTPDGAVMLTLTFCDCPVALLAPTVSVLDFPGATVAVWLAR